MPKSATFSAFVETATKCLATASASPPRPAKQPRACAMRVCHRLQGSEGLGGDDEQRFRRIQIARRLDEISSVDVGHEPERHGPIAVVLERLIGHYRAEVGAADTDIHHVADALPGVALPLAAANALGKIGHLVQHGMNLRHDVLAIDEDHRSPRRAQRYVQHRAILRDIHLLAAKHCVDPPAQPGLLGELDQQPERLVVDAVFGVVQKDTGSFRRHPLGACWVLGKKASQVPVPHRPLVIFERAPRRALAARLPARWLRSCSHMRHLPRFNPVVSNASRRAGEHRASPTVEIRHGRHLHCRRRGSAAAGHGALRRCLRRSRCPRAPARL